VGRFFDIHQFDVQITIDDYSIDTSLAKNEDGLCDNLTVTATTNQSRQASFSFIPPEEEVFLDDFEGSEVQILFRKANGVWEQMFFGYVDSAELSFISRKISLTCSDSRENRIIQLPLGVVGTIGSYSEAVFGSSKDDSEELSKRLQTVTADFDFDRYGNWALTSWAPKASPDITYLPTHISRNQEPMLGSTARSKTVNTINIEVNYTYQRLHQQSVNFVWGGYQDFFTSYWDVGRPSFPTKAGIQSAAVSSAWKITSPAGISFTDLWEAQGFAQSGGTIVWQPNQRTEEKVGRTSFSGYLKDGDGEFVSVGSPARLVPQYDPVLDSAGKQIMDVVKTTITDTSSHLCRGAFWQSSLKFTQSIKEKYTVTLSSPQSVDRYGTVDSFESVSITDPYDTKEWENSDTVAFVDYNFYNDKKPNYNKVHEALVVSLNKARHDLFDLFRDRTFTFRLKVLDPTVDLKHTVDVTTDELVRGASSSIRAVGKVSAINHFISFETEEYYTILQLKLSRMDQTPVTDSEWVIDSVAQDASYIGAPYTIPLTSHLGVDSSDPNDPIVSKFTGWFTNITLPTQQRTNYAEKFIVDFPAIPDSLRDEATYYSTTNFDINIPNDFLETST